MSRRRVLVSIEFTTDADRFTRSQLTDNAPGVPCVTDPGIRDAVTRLLIRGDWVEHRLGPLRSIVTTRPLTPEEHYQDAHAPADPGAPSTKRSSTTPSLIR